MNNNDRRVKLVTCGKTHPNYVDIICDQLDGHSDDHSGLLHYSRGGIVSKDRHYWRQ